MFCSDQPHSNAAFIKKKKKTKVLSGVTCSWLMACASFFLLRCLLWKCKII